MAVLSVNGHEVFRLHEGLHNFQLFLRGMPAYMYIRDAIVENVGA
jgi:hypothetical protein